MHINTTVDVSLGERSYPIHIGDDLLAGADQLLPSGAARPILVVSNTAVAPLHLRPLCTALRPAGAVDVLVLADGERHKQMAAVSSIHTRLLTNRYGRNALVVTLGGGVIGDVAGFAAATYQRGIDFVQIPTTLLAQVDASVGGKTGINHALGKNMIGAFHQPRAVIADLDVLASLPAREFAAGLAEVVKYGLIGDSGFLEWIESRVDSILAHDRDTLSEIVRRSCMNKAEIVAADERESGARALLNLGHTFAHAIETELGYGRWLHGEAVAAGICMAADTSRRLGWITAADCERIEVLLAALDLPVKPPPHLSQSRIRTLMARDKKVDASGLRLVLLRSIGEAVLVNADPATLDATLERYLS